ncbi:Tumor protein p53-inducible nuclear protein 1 [Dissostichus eleginoides]|uniref:Tumor protein p53-inducible nuclear protein 1 n=1 Tax=Dissostichus eleginoides TaxID=100907 RepID=A0AAD9C976_DISEL|nr:Tumor protein p53-inducible nuclear protein 1 [Dissostichus eleginoides]
MFQRFASALFGDEDPPSRGGEPGDGKEDKEEEEEEEWILVNYLAEARWPAPSATPPAPPSTPRLRLDACSMEESWFVTPPPCFTGRGSLLESSPLENLLIEHPSMSVYGPPRPRLDPRPITSSITSVTSRGKKKGRRSLDGQRHRPEVAVVPRRSSIHSACYARAGLLQPWVGNPVQRTQQLSRNALRRLNLLRPPKPPQHLHQPSQRHLNF